MDVRLGFGAQETLEDENDVGEEDNDDLEETATAAPSTTPPGGPCGAVAVSQVGVDDDSVEMRSIFQ